MVLQLVDFPPEILENVFQEVPAPDVYSLSLLSQYLHRHALRHYLSRSGVDFSTNPPSVDLYEYDEHIISALHLSEDITSLTSLSCTFNAKTTAFLHDMRHLTRFISRLTSVTSVNFEFLKVAPDAWVLPHSGWPKGSPTKGEVPQALDGLLRAVIERAACKELTVSNGQILTLEMPPKWVSPRKDPGSLAFRLAVVSSRWKTRIVHTFIRLWRWKNFQPMSALETVHLHSPLLTHHQLRHWTGVLNNSRVVTLSLRSAGFGDEQVSLLGSLSISTLENFKMLGLSKYPICGLDSFLSRHARSLVTLDFGDSYLAIGNTTFLVTLPRVTAVVAKAFALSYLFKRGRAAFPKLEQATVVENSSIDRAVREGVIGGPLHAALEQFPGIDLRLRLVVATRIAPDATNPPPIPALESALRRFEVVEMQTYRVMCSRDHMAMLGVWYRVLPSVRILIFPKGCLPVRADEIGVINKFGLSLRSCCPKLGALVVDGQPFDIKP